MAAAKHARRRPAPRRGTSHVRTLGAESEPRPETGKTEPANESEPTHAGPAPLQRLHVARDSGAGPRPKEHRETLTTEVAAADKRIAKLEGELASARQRLVVRENENRSLQTSLDLMIDEKSRLSHRLMESDAARSALSAAAKTRLAELEVELGLAREGPSLQAIEDHLLQTSLSSMAKENERLSCRLAQGDLAAEKAASHLKKLKAALTATEAERNRLAAAVKKGEERRQTETHVLNARLEATSSHAVATEKQLAEMRQRMLTCTEQMRTVLITVEAERNQLAAAVDDANQRLHGETRALNARLEAMSARAVAAEKLLAEVQQRSLARTEQLATALVTAEAQRNQLAAAVDEANQRREGETHALKARLEATSARAVAADKLLAEVRQSLLPRTEQLEMVLVTVEAERNKLAVAFHEAREKYRTETHTLNARVEAISLRAMAAEKLLVEVRRSLLTCTEERRSAERDVADAAVASHGADEKLDLLLKGFKTRDMALTHAEERIKSLAERIAQLETEAGRAGSQKSIEELNSRGDNCAGHNSKYLQRAQAVPTGTLLADTITF
jgi:hypothetical protein